MQLIHVRPRRPAHWLALSIAIIALALLAACGAASESSPAPSGAASESSATGSTESAAGQAEHQTATGSATADARVIDLAIANRDTDLTRKDLRVSQGDTVRLTFTADEPGEIHLHGYDLTAVVSPDQPGELVFDATTAGAFAINFHVFAEEGMETGDSGGDSHHGPGVPDQVVSEMPISVSISAEPDARGGVDVHIATEGFRFAEELVDQAHTPGAGHAHIYVDGVKLGRVFEPQYHIPNLAPGEHEIRVSLNTNDHSELVYDGAKVESTITVTVPNVGQEAGEGDKRHGPDDQDGGHEGHDHGSEVEILAEVHLGNLEVYP